MSLGARAVMLVFGGVIFGGGTAVEIGKFMRMSSDTMTNAVVAGVIAGLGLGLLLIGLVASDR